MSITIIDFPEYSTHTAYNQVPFVVDSTNKDKEGFRYTFQVVSGATVIAELEVPPTGPNDYGIATIERILQNYVSYNFNIGYLEQNNYAYKSFINYDINIGEKYGGEWSYDDYEYRFNPGLPYDGYTQLRQYAATDAHTYVVGDQINIVQADGGALKPVLNGLHTIVEIVNPYVIVIDLNFITDVGSGTAVSGTTTYADKRKVTFPTLETITGQTAINGVVPFTEQTLNTPDYAMTATTGDFKFLTTAPNGLKVTPTQDVVFNYLWTPIFLIDKLEVENSNGDIFSYDLGANASVNQVGVGPNNLSFDTIVAGSLPMIKDDTEWYTVKLVDTTYNDISETFKFNIDRRCSIDYGFGPTHISFLDRLGSFGSVALQLKMKDTTKVDQQSYLSQVGGVISGNYGYNTYDAGMTTVSSEVTRSILFNTNWMSEADSKYFDEVFTSGVVFLYFNGTYQRVVVKNSSFEKQYQRNKVLIRREVSITFSNQDIINI